MKKVVSILLAALFVLGFASVAFAAEGGEGIAIGVEDRDEAYGQAEAEYSADAAALEGYRSNDYYVTNPALLSFAMPANGSIGNIDSGSLPIRVNIDGAAVKTAYPSSCKLVWGIFKGDTCVEAFTSWTVSSYTTYESKYWYPYSNYAPYYTPGAYNIFAAIVDSSNTSKVIAAAEVDITLKQPARYVYLPQGTLYMSPGAKLKPKATVWPETASDKKVTWSSSKKAVATVNAKTGTIVAKKAGTTVITAKTANGIKRTMTVKVNNNKAGINTLAVINNKYKVVKKLSMRVGQEAFVGVRYSPYYASNNLLTWTSKKPGIVKVFPDGTLIAKKTGKATIVAKMCGKTATLAVTVKK